MSNLVEQISPPFLYGTAWKEERTQELTHLALQQGFRGIDTANQRKHYFEAAVGQGIRQAVDQGLLEREDLFVQTKFTHRGGQDHRLPYDPQAPVATQVQQSFASSEEHLGTIDSLVLHGPTSWRGLAAADLEAWAAMRDLKGQGKVKYLGVSNVNAAQLVDFCQTETPPDFVQDRCFARTGWGTQVRQVCARYGVVYQGFSLLTANQRELSHPQVQKMADRRGWTVPQVVMRFALDAGMLPLTGTTSALHMQQDLSIAQEPSLTVDEFRLLETIGL